MIEATWKHFIELEAGTWNIVLMECLKFTEISIKSTVTIPVTLSINLLHFKAGDCYKSGSFEFLKKAKNHS